MSDTAIRVENLSKMYRIGRAKQRHDTLRDLRVDTLRSSFRGRDGSPEEDTIWALKDLSFEVKRGEVVGVIGPNGAGKSTLLKILTRIVEPTGGSFDLYGRVGSLLEVGTGFHPELTGRENVYLNGAILGMGKTEIDRRFDEIVDFSGVEKFLDTPVKRYSSGMQVRLAFSVAAHLEPEVMLVDEVLAVGDVPFQKKCLGKMGDVAREGRTVLFVSHNMVAIRRLCDRAILLDGGCVGLDSDSEAAVSLYLLEEGRESERSCKFNLPNAPGDDHVRLLSVRAVIETGEVSQVFRIDQGIFIEIDFAVLQRIEDFHVYIRVFSADGVLLFGSGDWDQDDPDYPRSDFVPGTYRARCLIPKDLLNAGIYTLTVTGQIPEVR